MPNPTSPKHIGTFKYESCIFWHTYQYQYIPIGIFRYLIDLNSTPISKLWPKYGLGSGRFKLHLTFSYLGNVEPSVLYANSLKLFALSQYEDGTIAMNVLVTKLLGKNVKICHFMSYTEDMKLKPCSLDSAPKNTPILTYYMPKSNQQFKSYILGQGRSW